MDAEMKGKAPSRRPSGRQETLHRCPGASRHPDALAAGTLSREDFHLALAQAQFAGQQGDQCLVGGAVHGRGVQGDLECAGVAARHALAPGAGLDADFEDESFLDHFLAEGPGLM